MLLFLSPVAQFYSFLVGTIVFNYVYVIIFTKMLTESPSSVAEPEPAERRFEGPAPASPYVKNKNSERFSLPSFQYCLKLNL